MVNGSGANAGIFLTVLGPKLSECQKQKRYSRIWTAQPVTDSLAAFFLNDCDV